MPRRRPPRVFPERVTSAIESMIPGTLGGRVSSAAPIIGDAVAATIGGNASVTDLATGTVFYRDRYELAADGAQDLELTYLPVEASEHVYLNGIEQDEGTDWTRDGQVIELLTPMDALTADVLDVRYAYRFGAPVVPLDEPSSYALEVLADDPIAYYRVNETAGSTARDSSGNGHDATYVGAFDKGEASLMPTETDLCVLCTTINDYLSIPDDAAFDTSEITIEWWGNPGSSGSRVIYEHPGRCRLTLIGGNADLYVWESGAWVRVGTTFIAGLSNPVATLVHMVVTYDGSSFKGYRQGALLQTITSTHTLLAGTGDIKFGNYNANGASGHYDEMAIYGTALSATRIAAHFAAG